MSMNSDALMPVSVAAYSNRQRLFLRYYTGVLIDLVVLCLFDEFSDKVAVSSFSIALLAAIVLQILLKATIHVEHQVAEYFNSKPGKFMRFMRFMTYTLMLLTCTRVCSERCPRVRRYCFRRFILKTRIFLPFVSARTTPVTDAPAT